VVVSPTVRERRVNIVLPDRKPVDYSVPSEPNSPASIKKIANKFDTLDYQRALTLGDTLRRIKQDLDE
jgi:hypothetical protein